MNQKNHIIVINSSNHAKIVIDILRSEGRHAIAGLLDPFRSPGETTLGCPVLGKEEDLPRLIEELSLTGFIVAIGENDLRARIAARVRALCPHLRFITAVHPRATIGSEVSIGDGTVVMAGASVGPCCSVGQGCLLNTHASLDHDSVMDDFSSLAPRATTGGNCRIGAGAAIGIGAVLSHGIHIGEHTVVGASSLVLKRLDPFIVAYGTPATFVRSRKPGDRYL